MGIFSDSNLQKFLTVYHGQLLSTFFYDLIVRNVVRLVQNKLEWSYISNIALGVVFSMAIIWAIFAVWARVRRNLIICLVVLVVIFVVRIGVGIPDFIERWKQQQRQTVDEELVVYTCQLVVHIGGILATFILAQR